MRNVSASGAPNPQLLPLPMNTPGALGLNLQAQNAVLPPTWSIESSNTVIDPSGRVAARLGRTTITTTPAAGPLRSIFEYRTSSGTTKNIFAYDGGIASSISAPTNDLGGAVTVSNGRWYFQNFMDTAIGLQAGQPVIVYTGSGTFTTVTGSPQGGVGTAAYGRLWVMDADGHTLRYCALTDYTNWTTGDSGSIDLRKVWPLGQDTVTAIAGFNGTLAVFGKRQIILYGSKDPSILGLDVTQMLVTDAIEGTGCISQWTLAHIGAEVETSDLLFCSMVGVNSLQRLLINQSRPVQQLTKNVRDSLIQQLSSETASQISGFYSPTNGFYALSLPTSKYTWIVDMRHRFQDQDGDDVARITRWPIFFLTGVEVSNRTTYFGTTAGTVQQYLIGGDDNAAYQIILQVPWLDFGDDIAAHLKALKRVGAIVRAEAQGNITFTWFVDFQEAGTSTATTVPGDIFAEFGIGQYNIDQYGGTLALNILTADASGAEGQYFSLMISANTAGNFAVQQLSLLAKLLRIA